MELGNEIIAGVSINNVTGITGKRYELRDLMRAAREAEAMGFDGVWVHDGMTGRRTTAAYDPTAVLTAVAAQTERIRLCTGILIPHIAANSSRAFAPLGALSPSYGAQAVASRTPP